MKYRHQPFACLEDLTCLRCKKLAAPRGPAPLGQSTNKKHCICTHAQPNDLYCPYYRKSIFSLWRRFTSVEYESKSAAESRSHVESSVVHMKNLQSSTRKDIQEMCFLIMTVKQGTHFTRGDGNPDGAGFSLWRDIHAPDFKIGGNILDFLLYYYTQYFFLNNTCTICLLLLFLICNYFIYVFLHIYLPVYYYYY